MKKLFLLPIILLLHLQGWSQVTLSMVFPMGVHGIESEDSLLNKSSVLKREGIRKITTYEKLPNADGMSSSKTIYLTADGTMKAATFCHRIIKSNHPGFCITDTVLYDPMGRMVEFIAKDVQGVAYMWCKADFINDKKVKRTWIVKEPQKPVADTDISYLYYNEKAQLVRIEQEAKKYTPVNATLYYNEDGFLDSIKHDNPAWGTYVFKRKKKGKNKVIELETPYHKYKWVYNILGQCISSEWGSKRRTYYRNQTGQTFTAEAKADYYYNADGTLLKAVEKWSGKEVATTFFSYEK